MAKLSCCSPRTYSENDLGEPSSEVSKRFPNHSAVAMNSRPFTTSRATLVSAEVPLHVRCLNIFDLTLTQRIELEREKLTSSSETTQCSLIRNNQRPTDEVVCYFHFR